jgi:diguanylate cyclase (GGDEF)-like protein
MSERSEGTDGAGLPGQAPNSWSTSQLVDFLAVLSEQTDEAGTFRVAVERLLDAVDAEVGALFDHHGTPTVVGLAADDPQLPAFLAAARAGAGKVTITGLGTCCTAVLAVRDDPDGLCLFVARVGAEEFGPEEMLLLRGMAWVLHLALRPLRLLASLGERERLLDQVARVQRAIANRAPLPEVFDTVTEGVLDLLGTELAMLYLAEQDILLVASVSAVAEDYRPPAWPVRMRSSVGRAAYSEDRLVRVDDYARSAFAHPELVARGARAAMATPVRENGTVVGSLVTMSFRDAPPFTDLQEQALTTFADQISIALSDAKTLATAQHAIRDSVTGLPNRVLFLDRLGRTVSRGVRAHVLFLDLDRFKIANDTFGHAAGDELLRQVGRRLRECLRSDDCLARFGGDEYAVLLEDATSVEALRLAQRMLRTVRAPFLVAREEIIVSASIGIADSDDSGTADAVLRDADTAMYRAKHAGGNRCVVFEKTMHTVLVQRASLETDLRHAVERDQLFLAFQPIIDLRTGHTHTAEALVRWRHPVRGMIPPDEFIPVAEEAGLIVPVGRRVLVTACAIAATWPAAADGGPPPAVSVNLSTRQILDPNFVADVRDAVHTTGLPPERLLLEITESAFAGDAAFVLGQLQQIRALGVRLAIDDFGTGYSSLAYLRTFPVDILKIDRSFVEGVGSGPQGTAFLNTIVRLTETLSMTSIGEGVETDEQLTALRTMGCRLGQGFLLGRPMAPDDFVRSLAQPPVRT